MIPDTALLVIDMQGELLSREVLDRDRLIQNVNRLLDMFHRTDRPVFAVRHANKSFLSSGSPGWEIDGRIRLRDGDARIDKTHGNVFEEKGFVRALEATGCRKVVITGLVSNGCVQAACLGAVAAGYETWLASDAHSTFSKEASRVVAQWNERLGTAGALVRTTEEIRTALEG